MKLNLFSKALGMGLLALLCGGSQAQAKFPEGAIKIIVPFSAGGGVDGAARLIGKQLQNQLGVPVIIDNRAGANGTIGGKVVQTAPADGQTLLFSASTHVLAKNVMSAVSYDPLTDFSPVARVGEAPLLMVITPTLAPKNLKEVVAAAKAEPDKWNASLPALGAASHLATLLFAKQAGLKLQTITYKGTAPALTDVAGGHSQILMDSIVSIMPMAKSGKVRPIAVTSSKRSSIAPDIPTAVESGLPGLVAVTWYGIWAPKGTPQDRVQFLNHAVNKAVAELLRSGQFANLGVEPVMESVEQFNKYIHGYVHESADLLKGAGFKPE